MFHSYGTLSRRALLRDASLFAAVSVLGRPSLFGAAVTAGAPIVKTRGGNFRGSLEGGVRIFRGVPFAHAPIGALRFRAPVPLQPSTGVYEASAFQAEAMQPLEGAIPRSEDCLYLNIWAPEGKGPYPVFVWIHGGGFTGGRSFAPIFDGSAFAQAGIIVVTVAYRLGAFGFMDLESLLGPEYADSANNGTRDLITALEWVHNNIEAFGGDSKRVTVGGESAGAKVTAALLAIPDSVKLFHSAISESGGGERVLTHEQATTVAGEFASYWKQAGYSVADLKTAAPEKLIAVQERVIASSTIHFPFREQVDGALLPKRPVDLVAAGASKGKRLLIGSNLDESALFLGPKPQPPVKSSDLGNLKLAEFETVQQKYASLYPGKSLSQREILAVTAEEYWIPTLRMAEAHAGNGGETYMYRMDFASYNGRMAGEAYHSEDLGFVWDKLPKDDLQDEQAKALRDGVHGAWIAFIQGKTPAGPGLPEWPKFDLVKRPTMILDRVSRVENDPSAAERRLWDGVM